MEAVKNFTLTVTGLRGFNEAIITQGGITVKEVNPSTMESRLLENLYFAGEVLDLDAVSNDSRSSEVGMIDERYVLGKAEFVVFPFSRFGKIV